MSRFSAMTRLPNALLPASSLAGLSTHTPRWRPGLAGAHHSEIFASPCEASGAAAALALAADALPDGDDRMLFWVQDRSALATGGWPYRPGLPKRFRHRIVHVACDKPEDALFALEEGLRCCEVAAVVGEISGNPRALDFTASRRLTLAAERYGVPLWLIRLDARRDLSSAWMRWDVKAAPSPPPRWNPQAPGTPAWQAELFRARAHPPGTWILRDDSSGLAAEPFAAAEPPYPLGMAFAVGDRSLAAR